MARHTDMDLRDSSNRPTTNGEDTALSSQDDADKAGLRESAEHVGSFAGVTWRLFQEWGIEALEKEDAFKRIIETLDDQGTLAHQF